MNFLVARSENTNGFNLAVRRENSNFYHPYCLLKSKTLPTESIAPSSTDLSGDLTFHHSPHASIALNTLNKEKIGCSSLEPIQYFLPSDCVLVTTTSIAQDVTPLRTQDDLIQRMSQYRAIVDTVAAMISYVDRQECYQFANQQYEERLGLPVADIIGKTIQEVLGAKQYEQCRPHIQTVLSGQEVSYENVFVTRKGKQIHQYVTYVPNFGTDDTVLGFFVVAQDITSQKQIEEQLKQQAERERLVSVMTQKEVEERTIQLRQALALEAALKRITDKVRDSLDEKQILTSAVEELVNLLQVDCCDTALYDLETQTSTIYYEHTRVLPSIQGQVLKMEAWADVYAQLLKGECFQFCRIQDYGIRLLPQKQAVIFACPICDEQGTIGDLWIFDRADRGFNEIEIRLVQQVANQCAIALRQARLYQAVEAQVHELEKLNRLKDDFLSTVSHELRTPMTNIKMATQMLEIVLRQSGVFGTQGSVSARYFKILQDECQREIDLINDLLDLARLEAGTESLTLTEINPQQWVLSVVEPFLERANSQKQEIRVVLDASVSPQITHLAYLERIVTELLQNACKYTPAGQTIIIQVTSEATHWQIRVINSGVEITAEEQDRIFNKFYRIPKNDPWKHGGTGLGLALVKRLVEQLEGTIAVESRSAQTCFTVQLPVYCPNLTTHD